MAYPAHKKSMDQYVERVKQQAEKRKAMKPAPTVEKAMKKDEEAAGKAVTPAPTADTATKSVDEVPAKEAEPAAK
jgi:hypothetical protein